ncbi:BspA family leucine-rich repeat surface protein [Mycoplasma feriruminatoris]|uniref:BspA family leucine-rich repeat surface protein n=1 Tax=Mycoplasma feriruminatoris TaxID=1179777 RepID=A0ABY8HWQ2_9MOLU|nr:BspA family leucine-rich repeat surface protein [Mycoplasma feriruminatoris]WFQ93285.1 BspA family leucine-rich repeat surface protein [Mycoplasma feriruminatoris]
MKHLLKIISSLTILSTGVLAVSCTRKVDNKDIKNNISRDNKDKNKEPKTNDNKENKRDKHINDINNEENNSKGDSEKLPQDDPQSIPEILITDQEKNDAISALQKVFKEQEESFGSFHSYKDVLDQLKVYLEDVKIKHLNNLTLSNVNEENNKLKIDNKGTLNNIKIKYFDKEVVFTPKTVLDNEVSEKYSEANELIRIGYKFEKNLNNIKMKNVKDNIKKVPKHLPLKINSLEETFKKIKSEKIENLDKWNTKNIRNLKGTFSETDNFNQDISKWDVSNVVDMTEAFSVAKKFNVDLNLWNTTSVKEMRGVFWDAYSFNGNISKWDTRNVEDMSVMFSGAKNFDQDLSGWNTSKVVTMEGMFSDAEVFNKNISGWDTSKVATMSRMFQDAKKFNQNLKSWNVSKVTHAEGFKKGSSIDDKFLPSFSGSILSKL